MTEETKAQRRDAAPAPAERTHTRPTFSPNVDIYEKGDGLVLVADMPGVDEKSLDVRLEQGVLTITGRVAPEAPEGMQLIYSEYTVGDYERAFTLGGDFHTERIEASFSNGVLRLALPKAPEVKPKKIEIKTG